MAAEAAHVERDLACALHSVDMEENPPVLGNLADLDDFANVFDGLQYTSLVVGQHHADESCLGPYGGENIGRVDEPARLGSNVCHLDAMISYTVGSLQHRRVLNGSCNKVVAGSQQAEDGGVVSLGAAGVEDDLSLAAVEELRHGLAGAIKRGPRLLAV